MPEGKWPEEIWPEAGDPAEEGLMAWAPVEWAHVTCTGLEKDDTPDEGTPEEETRDEDTRDGDNRPVRDIRPQATTPCDKAVDTLTTADIADAQDTLRTEDLDLAETLRRCAAQVACLDRLECRDRVAPALVPQEWDSGEDLKAGPARVGTVRVGTVPIPIASVIETRAHVTPDRAIA